MIDLTSVGPESQLQLDLEERLQFATLVANLSARFINLPADKVDTQIEEGLREICEYFDLGHSALWQSSTSEPGIKLLSHLRRHPGMPPVPQRVDGGTFFPWVQQKIMRREIVCVPSTANAPPEAVTDKVNWETYGIKSVLALPLWVGDGPILGVLAIGATKEERNWSETVVNRLRLIGQVFANALARQRTEKALNESEARLRLAAASADAGLWTLEPVSGHIWATEKDKELLGFAPTDELDIHRVLNTVHPEDRDTVRRNIDDALMSGEDHSIEYRIVRSDGEIRWISSRGRRHPGEFGHPDNLMGVSTDVTDRKRAEQELWMLDIAREVQQQLLPRSNRAFPALDLAAACVPAWELGGDFYDFLPYGNGRLALALGDVSSKGTAAALLAALTIGILRAHSVDHPCATEQLLATLNERLNAARLNALFVAMVFAVFDSNARQITIANAGNPYPLRVRKGRIEEIPLTGVPLGLMPGTKYEPVSLDLQSGDALVFVSDGILECQSSKHEAFGTEHLAAVLTSLPSGASAEGISSAILSATDVFNGQASAQHDDRSLIVLRVTVDSSADPSRSSLGQ